VLKKTFWATVLLAGVCAAAPSRGAAAATPYSVTTFTTSYTAYDNGRDGPWKFPIKVWTPTRAGSYPLGIVVGGTEQCPNPLSCPTSYGSYAETIAQDAAKHGIITAAVHYDSKKTHFCGCTGSEAWSGETPQGEAMDCAPPKDGWDDKSRAIFDTSLTTSALHRILLAANTRSARASLSRGLVVFGQSQGSWIAHMAQAYTTRGAGGVGVRAAFLTGTGIRGYGSSLPKPYTVDCNKNGSTTVPPNAVRAFNGEHDHLLSVNTNASDPALYQGSYTFPIPPSLASAYGARRSLNKVTGACPVDSSGPDACYPYATTGGGGWRVVMDTDTMSGLADHGFFILSGTTIDTRWRNGAAAIDSSNPPISLRANLNWMAGRLGAPAIQF
jgi:hypothetical protein